MIHVSAHELAAVLATLITQPEAFGRPMSDQAYEDLLGEVGELLSRYGGGRLIDVQEPDPPRSSYTLRFLASDQSEAEPIAPDLEECEAMIPIDPHRSVMSTMLHALAERIR